ncbi:MAG: NADH-quinone oxidoreductase subunit C [Nitriliruptorales bacterium]
MASLEDLERRLQDRVGDLRTHVEYGELTAFVPADRIRDVLTVCRDDEELGFGHLSDLSGVHWPGGEEMLETQISTTGWPPHRLTRDRGTIEVTYHLLSMEHVHRLRLVVAVGDDDPRVPTVTDLYPTANYHEREVYDFYGVVFEDHPNLVRILMPDDWVGHPLRKDYPLGGVDTPYEGAFIEPPDQRVWARDVPGAAGGDEVGS